MKKFKRKDDAAPIWLIVLVVFIICFLMIPIVVIIGSSVTSVTTLTFPPKGFSLRWYKEFFTNEGGWISSAWVSIRLALFTTVGSVLIGSLAAYGIEKSKARNALLALFTMPLTVPTVISGLALLQLVNALKMDRSFFVIMCGHIMFVTPFVIRTMYTSFYRFNHSIEEASWVMGAGKVKTFLVVVLPAVKSGLLNSIFFAFITSFSNLTISTFLATGKNITLPIKIYAAAQFDPRPVLSAISTVVILVTVIAMMLIKKFGNKEA